MIVENPDDSQATFAEALHLTKTQQAINYN